MSLLEGYPKCPQLRDICRKSLMGPEYFEGSGYVDHRVDGISPNPDIRYQLKPGYAVRAFMDEYLVIPVGAPGADDSKMAVLSPVAEFIWSLLEVPRGFGEILSAVTDEFEVTAEVAEPDIRDFLRELEEHHFLLMEGEQS